MSDGMQLHSYLKICFGGQRHDHVSCEYLSPVSWQIHFCQEVRTLAIKYDTT